MEKKDLCFALLIDGDNVSYKDVPDVIGQLIPLGSIFIKRVYRDFTTPQAAPWGSVINACALTPMQQFSYTSGKNVTDSTMIIDAMDILHEGNVNAFCIMSSDSDFTGLAKRLKESGAFVYGAGRSTTPSSFIVACDRFFKLDGDGAATEDGDESAPLSESGFIEYVKSIISDNPNGFMFLTTIMNIIYRKYPDFDCRNYGYKKVVDLLSNSGQFLITHKSDLSVTVSLAK